MILGLLWHPLHMSSLMHILLLIMTPHENISQTRLPRPTIEEELNCDVPPIISADYIYGNFFDPPSEEMDVNMSSGDIYMSVGGQMTPGKYWLQLLWFLAWFSLCRHSCYIIVYPTALWGRGSSSLDFPSGPFAYSCWTASCSIRGCNEFRTASHAFRVACQLNAPLVLADYFIAHKLAPPSLSPPAHCLQPHLTCSSCHFCHPRSSRHWEQTTFNPQHDAQVSWTHWWVLGAPDVYEMPVHVSEHFCTWSQVLHLPDPHLSVNTWVWWWCRVPHSWISSFEG